MIVGRQGYQNGSYPSYLRFVDDNILYPLSWTNLSKCLTLKEVGMRINLNKTKVMSCEDGDAIIELFIKTF